jgi:hypothetical protein
MIGRYDCVEGFWTSACLKGCMESLYPVCGVLTFHTAITVRYEEPEKSDLWFNNHAY